MKTTLKQVGLDPTAIDRSADPCQDFYQYACGGWLARTKIPADRPRYGRISELYDRNQKELEHILAAAERTKSESPMLHKLGAFYGSCMNQKALEKAGTSGIADLLETARHVRNRKTLDAAIAALHRYRIWPLFSLARDQDYKNSMSQIAELDQAGSAFRTAPTTSRRARRSSRSGTSTGPTSPACSSSSATGTAGPPALPGT